MTDDQFAMIAGLLAEIRDALVPVDDDGTCQHPEDKRVDLSSFGDRDHWVCRICKFDNKAS